MKKDNCECCGTTIVSNKYLCQSCFEDNEIAIVGYRDEANRVITEFVNKYQTGCTTFSPTLAEDIKDALNTLRDIAGDSKDLQAQDIAELMNINKGIHYSKVIPVIIEFQAKVNKNIDAQKLTTAPKEKREVLTDDEIPF
jgi:hypothetical protein